MKPNDGLPERIDGEVVYRTTAREFVHSFPEIIHTGRYPCTENF
jgi:methionine synthase I (cobalamin-dependent)